MPSPVARRLPVETALGVGGLGGVSFWRAESGGGIACVVECLRGELRHQRVVRVAAGR